MITIIDYGMGNLGSIKNMLKKIGVQSMITSEIADINQAEKIILPGVGVFDKAMQNLNDLGIVDLIRERALQDKIPMLGICLGMQLLGNKSEEGSLDGLRLIPGDIRRFDLPSNLKVPHMGWNDVEITQDSILFHETLEIPRYYFVHTYYFDCIDESHVVGKSSYGTLFTSVIQNGNIWGTQFHPEKSHKYGMKLLKNFVELS